MKNKLAEIRANKSMSQDKLAELLQVSQNSQFLGNRTYFTKTLSNAAH